MARRKQPVIPDALLDQLLAGTDAKTAFEKDGLLDELKKVLAERALNAEMDHHVETADGDGNRRNGYGKKTVLTGTGKVALEVPRDRLATFDPQLIAKYQRRFPGFDEKIVSMCARGLSPREIQGHLREIYGLDVSPDLVSAVTDAVLEAVAEGQNRPPGSPLSFDFLRCHPHQGARRRDGAQQGGLKSPLASARTGRRKSLGCGSSRVRVPSSGLRVMNKLKSLRRRGRADRLAIDGLKGFPEAITAVFPQAQVQTCVVHLIRHSLAFVSSKDRKSLVAALKNIYKAKDADAGKAALDGFAESPWGRKYPAIAQSWRRDWPEVIPFFAFPDDVRRIIYTTNAIESLNAKLRRAVRSRGHFPTDEAALKLLFLILNLAAKEWKMPPREWAMAKAQLAILFEDRFTLAL